MLPQVPLPRMTPSAPPRMLAKPPKAPLRGQGPSGAPAPAQDDPIKAIAMQQAQAAQAAPVRAQPAPVPVRYSPAPAPAPALAPASPYAQQPPAKNPMPQQQMALDPRAQAIDAMKAKTAGDLLSPTSQVAFMKTGDPYTPAPVGNVVPASVAPAPMNYVPPNPSAAPVAATLAQAKVPQGLPPALLPDNLLPYEPERVGADVFGPKSSVGINPNYDPTKPHLGERLKVDTEPPVRAEEIVGVDPSSAIDWDVLDPSKNPGPGFDWDSELGKWKAVPMPPGVTADSPGWYYDMNDGWQYDPYASVKDKVALSASEVMDKDLSEFGFNAEELQAQEDQIIRQAAEAKAKAMQQMAGRGLGGSGLEIAGLGNIDVGAISAITDLKTENKALQIEQRLNEIKTYLAAFGSQLDDKTRNELAAEAMELQKDQLEYEQSEQKEADRHTLLNNAIAQLGGEEWDAEALAQAYDKLDAGASIQDILRDLIEDSGGKLLPKSDEPTSGTPPGGISGYQGDPGTESDNYAEPKNPFGEKKNPFDENNNNSWYYASESERKAQYMEYAASAMDAGQAPLSEDDWNKWQEQTYQHWLKQQHIFNKK
jgi:hypothetical protein